MSINPVPPTNAEAATQSADPSLRRDRQSLSTEQGTDRSNPGTSPKQQAAAAQAAAEIGEDEVQVQRDSENNGEIVIKYVDRSGAVILQVPSSQVLSMTRAIEQEFAQQAKVRAGSAEAPLQGGKRDGH